MRKSVANKNRFNTYGYTNMEKEYKRSLILMAIFVAIVIGLSAQGKYNPGLQMDTAFTQPGDYQPRIEYGWPFPFWRDYKNDRFNVLSHKVDLRSLVLNCLVWGGVTFFVSTPAIFKYLGCRK